MGDWLCICPMLSIHITSHMLGYVIGQAVGGGWADRTENVLNIAYLPTWTSRWNPEKTPLIWGNEVHIVSLLGISSYYFVSRPSQFLENMEIKNKMQYGIIIDRLHWGHLRYVPCFIVIFNVKVKIGWRSMSDYMCNCLMSIKIFLLQQLDDFTLNSLLCNYWQHSQQIVLKLLQMSNHPHTFYIFKFLS